MKYRDEFHIASTAILLSVAMVGISVIVPKESRVPTAKTTLTEAPETAAEAEAAQQEEFPIYSQDDSSYDNSYDSSDSDSSDRDQITYPTDDSEDGSGNDTSDIPDYTEDTSDDSGQDDSEDLDYIDNSGDTSSDNGDNGDYTEDTSDQDIEYYE